jgi:hypothetical protein
MKAGIVEWERKSIANVKHTFRNNERTRKSSARQRFGKCIPVEMDEDGTTE